MPDFNLGESIPPDTAHVSLKLPLLILRFEMTQPYTTPNP